MERVSLDKIARALVPHTVLIILLAVFVAAEIIVRVPWFSALHTPLSGQQLYVGPGLNRSPSPQVIFMGNSRIRVGVSPKIIGEILDLPSNQVSNIAFDSGKPQEFLRVYTQYRSQLREAEILIVGVDAKMFNKALVAERASATIPGDNTSLRTWLHSSHWTEQVDFKASQYWITLEKRATVGEYLKHLLRVKVLRRGPSYIDDLGRVMSGPERNTYLTDDDFRNRDDFENYTFDERELKALQGLVSLAREDGTEVVLVDAPLGPVYRTMVETRFPDEDIHWRHRIWETTGLSVEKLPLTSSICSDWKKCFVDEGHMNYTGAQGYSEDMGKWLKARFPGLLVTEQTTYPGSQSISKRN